MPIHDNSVIAYHLMDKDGRRKAILGVYGPRSELTDRQVTYALGFQDLNAARPRISEMVNAGILIECGKVKDELTGRPVRLTRLARKQTQQDFL